jgi:surface protein
MFWKASAFNQPIGNWNVSQVRTMEGMFDSARAFNQDISKWNVSQVTTMKKMFNNSPFDFKSYDGDLNRDLIKRYSEQTTPLPDIYKKRGGRKGKTRKTNGKQKKGKQTRRKVMKQSRRKGKKTNKK